MSIRNPSFPNPPPPIHPNPRHPGSGRLPRQRLAAITINTVLILHCWLQKPSTRTPYPSPNTLPLQESRGEAEDKGAFHMSLCFLTSSAKQCLQDGRIKTTSEKPTTKKPTKNTLIKKQRNNLFNKELIYHQCHQGEKLVLTFIFPSL